MWNSTTAYSVGDMVIVNDVWLGSDKAIYIATQANTNLYPMDNVPTWIYVGGPAKRQVYPVRFRFQMVAGSLQATQSLRTILHITSLRLARHLCPFQ